MLCITESFDKSSLRAKSNDGKPNPGLVASALGPIAGGIIGHYIDSGNPYTFAHGMVNGFNLGNFAGELINKRPLGQAARNLALSSIAGNAATNVLARDGVPLAGVAGIVASRLPLVFSNYVLSKQKKIK